MSKDKSSPPSTGSPGAVGRLASALRRVISRDRDQPPATAPQPAEQEAPRFTPSAMSAPPPIGPDLAARIDVPFRDEAPESAEWRDIEAGFSQLVDGGLWPSLLDRLRGTDQSRQQFASGKRYYEIAIAGALAPVTRHLRSKPANIAEAEAALPVFEAVHAAHSRDYMPAVIFGRALIEVGAALRGAGSPGAAPQAEAAAAPYYARAEALLEAFDPIEQNSPMLAEARYLLASGVEDGADFLRDWYEDWADLDPSNPHMLMTHSRYLMPTWYGDLDEIEAEARRAVHRAADGLGAGAYAFFWWKPLEAYPTAMGKLDSALFLKGMQDTLAATMSQDLANRFAGLLFRLSHSQIEGDGPLAAQAAITQRRLAEGFGRIVRGHVREILVPLWPLDAEGIRAALAWTFRDELAANLVVRRGERGLQATVAAGE